MTDRDYVDIVTALRKMADGDWLADPVSPRRSADEIERLRKERNAFKEERDELIRISNKLKRERDEARRDLCYADEGWPFPDDVAREKARERGWDCFEEAP